MSRTLIEFGSEPPVVNVLTECPACERPVTLEDVELGEIYPLSGPCEHCGAELGGSVLIEAAFDVSAELESAS